MLSEILKDLRKEKGVLQKDVANYLNITASAYGFYEQGKRVPDAETITKLAKYFNVSTDYLLNNDTKNISEMKIPKEYTDKYKVTSRDKKQYQKEMEKANEAFFMDDELDESAKKEMLDLMSELFWKAKTMNKEQRNKKK